MKTDGKKRPIVGRLLFIVCCALMVCCLAVSFVTAAESEQFTPTEVQPNDFIEPLRQSALAGSAEAQFELGLIFEYGRGVEQDDAQAAYWYKQSADQDFPDSLYRLAVFSDNGWGQPVNKERAFKLYKSAAEKGHTLAQHDVAMMYYQGSGVRQDVVQAYKWLKIAELNGSPLMQKHLRRIQRDMTSDEIKEAEFFANQWAGQSGI